MKYCKVAHLCPWDSPKEKDSCGFRKDMKEKDSCYNLLISGSAGSMIIKKNVFKEGE